MVLTYADAAAAPGKASAGISAGDHAAGLASSLADLASYLSR